LQADPPPFVITSAFPFAGEVRFFPSPSRWPIEDRTVQEVKPKTLKKVAFISEELFRSVLAGESLASLYSKAFPLQGQQVLASPAEVQRLPETLRQNGAAIWEVEQRPRVTLGRNVQNSSIFHSGRVSYASGCGLWFGVRWFGEEAQMRKTLLNLLAELGDAGLGGIRSAGFGACKFQPGGALELPEAGQGVWLSLSRYLPREDEMDALQDERAGYRLSPVGGWIGAPAGKGQRRKTVHMLSEGAVLGPLNRPVPGQVVDLRPSYESDDDPLKMRVYRCGLALAVGMGGN
jgi:CRISPR-associated protein Csm4